MYLLIRITHRLSSTREYAPGSFSSKSYISTLKSKTVSKRCLKLDLALVGISSSVKGGVLGEVLSTGR